MEKPPGKQGSNSACPAECIDNKDEDGDTEVEDDEVSQMEETESAGMTLPGKQALLTTKFESDSDIPDSKKDKNDGTKVEGDKTNQLGETESVEVTRFQGKRALLTRKRKLDSDIPDSKKK